LYTAYSTVQKDIESTRNDPVPMHLRNAPTGLMKNLGYGKDYRYPHDHPGHFVEEKYLPDNLQGKRYYIPSDEGHEKTIKQRLKEWWGKKKGA